MSVAASPTCCHNVDVSSMVAKIVTMLLIKLTCRGMWLGQRVATMGMSSCLLRPFADMPGAPSDISC